MRTPLLILSLICMSIFIYLMQYWIFSRPVDTTFYFLQDLAFVPLSVLLVTLGINTVLNQRDRQAMLEKVSIVVNEFYAEAGIELIAELRGYIVNSAEISAALQMDAHWKDKDFFTAKTFVMSHKIKIEIGSNDLYKLRYLLVAKKDHLLRLFENANLMEHDTFTDMLWAVYHVYDELRSRDSFDSLPEPDVRHLEIDIQRAIGLLLSEWIDSMHTLKGRYPYLYSLAVRKCPFGNGHIIFKK